ncbi:unnamed protein product [Amoebophrya sp. A25]|nr:unnamed protein product [Amoebophrya sp. A25]|eukprot:GSA25T00020071001.1
MMQPAQKSTREAFPLQKVVESDDVVGFVNRLDQVREILIEDRRYDQWSWGLLHFVAGYSAVNIFDFIFTGKIPPTNPITITKDEAPLAVAGAKNSAAENGAISIGKSLLEELVERKIEEKRSEVASKEEVKDEESASDSTVDEAAVRKNVVSRLLLCPAVDRELPMHLAAQSGGDIIMRRLLALESKELWGKKMVRSLQVMGKNADGQTPLHVAVEHVGAKRDLNFLAVLLQHGGKDALFLKDNDGCDIFTLAHAMTNRGAEIEALLLTEMKNIRASAGGVVEVVRKSNNEAKLLSPKISSASKAGA